MDNSYEQFAVKELTKEIRFGVSLVGISEESLKTIRESGLVKSFLLGISSAEKNESN